MTIQKPRGWSYKYRWWTISLSELKNGKLIKYDDGLRLFYIKNPNSEMQSPRLTGSDFKYDFGEDGENSWIYTEVDFHSNMIWGIMILDK